MAGFDAKQLAQDAMRRIATIQNMISALEDVTWFLQGHQRKDLDTGNLRTTLFAIELEEWRNAMMWGLVLDHNELVRLRAAVYDRFLKDGIHVAHYFSGGVDPGMWLSADEDEFRAMCLELFKPGDKK